MTKNDCQKHYVVVMVIHHPLIEYGIFVNNIQKLLLGFLRDKNALMCKYHQGEKGKNMSKVMIT